MDEQRTLSLKQKAFCDYYIMSGNATASAIKAGYSKKSARAIACENLTKPYILAYVRNRTEEIESKRTADMQEVQELLARVLRGEEKEDVAKFNPETGEMEVVTMKPSNRDKLKAAEMVARTHGAFTENRNVNVQEVVIHDNI